ncbi:unknown protein [Seminavis robusta]|uniref:Uncharacterized protein n=1 Tax=Seminavis robusta TaxID=568900 RepID=A0A9N8D535_9STRA|nr:unknown protein [Seminavis robusta]|eukprot:Sro6_g005340.1 n/a (586) ;mRNA; f:161423-163180
MAGAAAKFADYLVQECRSMVATQCGEICMADKADGKDLDGQKELMGKCFHGSAGYGSCLTNLIEGKGDYASLYDRMAIENNREGNELRKDGYSLILRDLVSCDEGKFKPRNICCQDRFSFNVALAATTFYVHSRGFTREALAKTKGELIQGRNVYDRGNRCIANYKTALKYHDEFCPKSSPEPYPSGKGLDDILMYVRQKMYMLLKGAKNKDGARRVKKDADSFTAEEMPEKYMFEGYMVFVLWGPKALCGKTLSCLSEDGKKVEKVGRAAIREKELKIKQLERSSNEGGTGPFNRGLAVKDKFACASLAMSEHKAATRNVRDLLYHNNLSETNCLTQLGHLNNMIDRAERRKNDREVSLLEKRKDALFDKLDSLSKRKAELEAQSDQLVKRAKLPQTQALYESMGIFAVPKDVDVATKPTVDEDSTLTNKTPSKQLRKLPSHCSQLSGAGEEEDDDDDDDGEVEFVQEVVPRSEKAIGIDNPEDEIDEPFVVVNPPFTGVAARLPPDAQAVLLRLRQKEAAGIPIGDPTFYEQQTMVACAEMQQGRDGVGHISYEPGSVYYANKAQADDLNAASAKTYYMQEED